MSTVVLAIGVFALLLAIIIWLEHLATKKDLERATLKEQNALINKQRDVDINTVDDADRVFDSIDKSMSKADKPKKRNKGTAKKRRS